jgi:hypothetical protein
MCLFWGKEFVPGFGKHLVERPDCHYGTRFGNRNMANEEDGMVGTL